MSHAAVIDLRPMRTQRGADATSEIQSIHAQQHDVIYYEGDPAGRYFRLIDGAVMLYRLLPDGRRQIVELLGPGDYFGLSHEEEFDCTAEVLRPSMISAYDRDACSRNHEFQADLASYLVEHVAKAHGHTVLLGRKSASERIASFLCNLVADPDAQSAKVRLMMTRQEIADFLGLTIETVSRSFSDLRRRGLILMERQDLISIADLSALTALTGDE